MRRRTTPINFRFIPITREEVVESARILGMSDEQIRAEMLLCRIGYARGIAERVSAAPPEQRAAILKQWILEQGTYFNGEPDPGARATPEAATDADALEEVFDSLWRARGWAKLLSPLRADPCRVIEAGTKDH